MKKLILRWLLGTDDIEHYFKLLRKDNERIKEEMDLIDAHLKTLNEEKENLDIIRKLIKICDIHGINADEEIKKIEL